MSLDRNPTVTDAIEAIKALREELDNVKDELSSCKSEVSRLNRNNTHLVVENKSLKAEVTRLMAEIEKLGGSKVEKDSTNSSVPPTQQSIAGQAALRTRSLREPSGRPSGGQKGHVGHELAKTANPAKKEEHRVGTCPHCGAVIPEDAEQVCTMTTQVIDIAGILAEPEVTEHLRYTAICPHCHKKAHAKLPSGSGKKTAYGPKLQALVIYLSVVQSVTFDRIAETMRDVFCVKSFSEGTVKNILERNAKKLLPVYTALLEHIGKEEAAGMDETGVYINKLLCWFWCLQCEKYCYVFADRSRGIKALEEHGILPYLKRLYSIQTVTAPTSRWRSAATRSVLPTCSETCSTFVTSTSSSSGQARCRNCCAMPYTHGMKARAEYPERRSGNPSRKGWTGSLMRT